MRSFDDYVRERRRIILACDEIEAVWRQIVCGRSPLEDLAGPSGSTQECSAVSVALADVRKRLESSTIEIGLFGNVKRGKSTLMNALVGEVVSSMRVTPETAVPVWVENGPRRSTVVFDDGKVEEVADAVSAAKMASQQHRRDHPERSVTRVIQRLPLDWLPAGLRLVDTPGLDDPSHARDYEDLTLAELGRVAAAVFVFVSPPGPAGEEIRLLSTLGSHGVDKVFLVCNFYPDQWANAEEREQVTRYIESVVTAGAADGVAHDDVRVYQVAAKAALIAKTAGDECGYASSGVERLRADLETYLSKGALPRLLSGVSRRMQAAVDLALDTLRERERVLLAPHLLQTVRDEQRARVTRSRATLVEITEEVHSEARSLRAALVSTITEPYRLTASTVEEATTIAQVGQAEHRMRLLVETAASRASLLFDQKSGLAEERVRRRLFDSFGVTDRLATSGRVELKWSKLAADDGLTSFTTEHTDWARAGSAASISAVGVGLLGGAISGGAGLALIAAGPVGWIIGLAAGAALGALTAFGVSTVAGRGHLSPEDRSKVLAAIGRTSAAAEQLASAAASEWAEQLERTLRTEQNRFFGDQEDELRRVERILGDEVGRQAALREVAALVERLSTLR